jgi:hypothetical protein
MPSTVIGSPTWNQRGLVITSMDAQEQVNGLVTVQVEYTGPADRHDIISRSFYQDAPPPIFPSVVSPSELVTNRLYMESRTVSRANGLTTVKANYVGGLVRQGFRGFFISEQLDRTQRDFVLTNGQSSFVNFTGIVSMVNGVFFNLRYEVYKISLEFVRVGQASAASLPEIQKSDVARNFRASRVVGDITSNEETPAPMPFIFGVPWDQYTLNNKLLSVEESREFSTPTVAVVTLRHRLT